MLIGQRVLFCSFLLFLDVEEEVVKKNVNQMDSSGQTLIDNFDTGIFLTKNMEFLI